MKTQFTEKKTLRKMKREFDDYSEESRKAKIKKPKRGHKIVIIDGESDENEYFDEE
ncbi:MAG: hypothetical protein PHD82_01325 [Candidatus Riflebacteria bacterium]|nr:hypothetical protein [Candidatus Riflebacteria bacterium]